MCQHYYQEWPVEITIKCSSDGKESKHNDNDDVCYHIGQHLKPKKSVHLLTDMMKITVNSSQNIKLNHYSRLLISGNFTFVALHKKSGRHIFLCDINFDRIFVIVKGRIILLTWLPNVIKRFTGLLLLDRVVSECKNFLKHFVGRFLSSKCSKRFDDVLDDLVESPKPLAENHAHVEDAVSVDVLEHEGDTNHLHEKEDDLHNNP